MLFCQLRERFLQCSEARLQFFVRVPYLREGNRQLLDAVQKVALKGGIGEIGAFAIPRAKSLEKSDVVVDRIIPPIEDTFIFHLSKYL